MADIERLKELALKCRDETWPAEYGKLFRAAANPSAVLDLIAEVERLREAVDLIAKQKTSAEISQLDQEAADYQGGYDECIRTARAARAAYRREG